MRGLVAEPGDPLLVGDLAAQVGDTGLDVDRHVALRRVGVTEDLGLDLAGEPDVVEVGRAAGRGGRHGALGLVSRLGRRRGGLSRARTRLGGGLVAESAAMGGVEEVPRRGAGGRAERECDETLHTVGATPGLRAETGERWPRGRSPRSAIAAPGARGSAAAPSAPPLEAAELFEHLVAPLVRAQRAVAIGGDAQVALGLGLVLGDEIALAQQLDDRDVLLLEPVLC